MATLEEVNARLAKIDIKGKPYVQVNQRILAFWELHPDGRIITQKLSDDGKRCDFLASVYIGDAIVATGHSFEYREQGMVNKTSYVENAETSAIGRALGVLGIGITESLASADEMQNALEHQETTNKGSRVKSGGNKDVLAQAKQTLWSAEKKFCAKNGIDDAAAWHAEKIATRTDYADDAETLERIAAELMEVISQ